MTVLSLFDAEPSPEPCRFPDHTRATAFRYGCRCAECRAAKASASTGVCSLAWCSAPRVPKTSRCAEHWLTCAVEGCPNPRRRAQAARFCEDHASHKVPGARKLVSASCLVCGATTTHLAQGRAVVLPLCRVHANARTTLSRWRTVYGLSEARMRQFTADPVCWVCGRSLAWMFDWRSSDVLDRRVHVDHDHRCCPGAGSCGECVRGLAHRTCNLQLGNLEAMLDQIGAARVVNLVQVLSRIDDAS